MTDPSSKTSPYRRDLAHVISPAGTTITYSQYGSGPPLVLVHGSFSNHQTNWAFVAPMLAKTFTVYAVARRGRGGTDATEGHGVADEARDVAALIQEIGEPVFLLGHSYGAHVALSAAAAMPDRVRSLILYEPPWPHILGDDVLSRLEKLARAGEWDAFVKTFFGEVLSVPGEELNELQASELWPPIVADAPATLGDLRAINRYTFNAEAFRDLPVPVTLQIGSESPRGLFVTDALAAVLPDVRIKQLSGQAHEGMMTGPEEYAEVVSRSLLPERHNAVPLPPDGSFAGSGSSIQRPPEAHQRYGRIGKNEEREQGCFKSDRR